MKTPESFMHYFRTNYPGPDTIIHSPDWHAPKIYAAAIAASTSDEQRSPEEPKPKSCYDCIHFTPCKWAIRNLTMPPFKSDAAIAPYLKAITEATAAACAVFEQRKET